MSEDKDEDNVLAKPMPFIVPNHDLMFFRFAGKNGTVLTLERMFASWNVYEYTDPLSRGRCWWYELEDFTKAFVSIYDYLNMSVATEPQGWIRADDIVTDEDGDSWHRTRRARMEHGERVIYLNGENPDAT